MATKKQPTTEVVSWEEELEALSVEVALSEVTNSGGTFLSTKGGTFSYRDNDIGSELSVVIVDHILENHYYEGRYDPDVVSVPICFSFSKQEEGMSPHELSSEPQNVDCNSCPHNQYGSSSTGKGKECKNVRRLALILGDNLDDVDNSEVVFLKLPVTSVKAWSMYVQQLSGVLKRPPLGVVTLISIVPDPKTQFRIQFKVEDKITDGGLIKQLLNKRELVKDQLIRPYVLPEIEEVKPKPSNKRRKY